MASLKSFIKATLLLLSIIICSCTSSTDKGVELSFIPCENDDEMGYLDKEGNFVAMPSFENNLTGVINGYFLLMTSCMKSAAIFKIHQGFCFVIFRKLEL